jgi:hypothetical protein
MNMVLFWSFNDNTYDTYSGLRVATELEAREVDQLWEHGKALRNKVRRMEEELESFKEDLHRDYQMKEKVKDKMLHSFHLNPEHLLVSMRKSIVQPVAAARKEKRKDAGAADFQSTTGRTPLSDEVQIRIPKKSSPDEDTRRHRFVLTKEQAIQAMQMQRVWNKPIVKKFKLPATQVAAAAQLAGTNNRF